MIALAILSFNFVTLAGILIGVLLQSSAVRGIVEATYVHAADLSLGRSVPVAPDRLTRAAVGAVLLNKGNALSKSKILVLSFISSALFLMTLAASFSALPDSARLPAILGGYQGKLLAVGFFVMAAWAGHFIYDYALSFVLLKIHQRNEQRRPRYQILLMLASAVAVSAAPTGAFLGYYLLRVNTSEVPELALFAPLYVNGPSILWQLLINDFFFDEFPIQFSAAQLVMVWMSALVSAALPVVDVCVRAIAGSPWLMRATAQLALKVSTTNAQRLLTTSLASFAVGNGLCQIFGVSIQLPR